MYRVVLSLTSAGDSGLANWRNNAFYLPKCSILIYFKEILSNTEMSAKLYLFCFKQQVSQTIPQVGWGVFELERGLHLLPHPFHSVPLISTVDSRTDLLDRNKEVFLLAYSSRPSAAWVGNLQPMGQTCSTRVPNFQPHLSKFGPPGLQR